MQDGSTVEIEYRLPKPEDCTVEPLTVDEVMSTLQNYQRHEPMNVPKGTPEAARTPMTPGETLPSASGIQPLSEETFNELAAAEREWLACKLYGSPFQVWALETEPRIRDWFQNRYMPMFDMEQIRQDLEQMAKEYEDSGRVEGLSWDADKATWLPMVPAYSQGYSNVQMSQWDATLTVFWMNRDGVALLGFGKSEDDPQVQAFLNTSVLERNLPNAWYFQRDDATGRWLLRDMTLSRG